MNVFEPCARVIDSCNLATVVMFAEDIQQEESQSKSNDQSMVFLFYEYCTVSGVDECV